MKALEKLLSSAIHQLDADKQRPLVDLSDEDRRANAVALVSALFEQFLRIHPFANGNGHAARLLLIAMLGRSGYWLQRFRIEPRPPEPTYSEAIKASRDGNRAPLEQFVLSLL
jgi:Fic family protein